MESLHRRARSKDRSGFKAGIEVVNMFGGSSDKKLMDQIFNLKFTSKQLVRQAARCEKEEKAERLKIKKAIEKGNMEGAKIYAQNAIRKKNEALNFLKLGSRLDAVVARLNTQASMQAVSKSMGSIVKALQKALDSNNVEKIAHTMDEFEKQSMNLDVPSDVMNDTMSNQMAMSTPEDEVQGLLQQVAAQHGLEEKLSMPEAGSTAVGVGVGAGRVEEESDLTKRLAELRGGAGR